MSHRNRPSTTKPRSRSAGFTAMASLVFLLGLVSGAATALAQAGAVTETDAADYLGTWALSADFQGNAVQMTLEIVPLEGEVRAALSSAMSPDPQLIEEITSGDEGLDLAWEADFGGQMVRIVIKASLTDDQLSGTFGDEGGFFSADFTGVRAEKAAEIVVSAIATAAEQAGQPQRRRRFGGVVEASMAFGDAQVRVSFGALKLGSADHQSLLGLADGDVFTFPGNRCFKLRTDIDLRFGDTTVAAHNFGPDYPGAYGLWLKKVEGGWSLVFNDLPDVWGTMYHPEKDVTEVALELEQLEEPAEELSFEVLETEEGGLIRIAWDRQAWTAGFAVP